MLRAILDTGWGWYAVLFSLDRCGRALCCFLEVRLLLQVDHRWIEKGSECICKGDWEPRVEVDRWDVL